MRAALLGVAAAAALSACGGPAGPTPEDLARAGLVRLRAEAAQRGAEACRAACERSLALLDSGARVEDVEVPEARRICGAAGIM